MRGTPTTSLGEDLDRSIEADSQQVGLAAICAFDHKAGPIWQPLGRPEIEITRGQPPGLRAVQLRDEQREPVLFFEHICDLATAGPGPLGTSIRVTDNGDPGPVITDQDQVGSVQVVFGQVGGQHPPVVGCPRVENVAVDGANYSGLGAVDIDHAQP
jgi:hypothetical protein